MLRWTLLAGAASLPLALALVAPPARIAPPRTAIRELWPGCGHSTPQPCPAPTKASTSRAAPTRRRRRGARHSIKANHTSSTTTRPSVSERAAYTRGAVRRAAADADPHDEEPVRGERLLVVRSLFNSYVGEGYAASTATAAASAAEAVRGAAPDVMLKLNAWVPAQAPET